MNNNNKEVGSFNDKGFSHYVKWCLVAIFGLAFVIVACIGTVSDPLMWATAIMFAYAFGERFVRNYAKATASVPEQVATIADVKQAITGEVPWAVEPETPAPVATAIKEEPKPTVEKPFAFQELPPDQQAICVEWFDHIYKSKPIMPTVVNLPETANLMPNQLREWRWVQAGEQLRAQQDKIFPHKDLEDAFRAAPCRAQVHADISTCWNRARNSWLTYAFQLWEFAESQ